MDFEFWDNCWHRDSQPFHVFEPHPLLKKHISFFDSAKKLLLPLSGKSVDPIYLAAKGIYSTSIEFNPKAVEAFIHENQLQPSQITCKEDTNKKRYCFVNFEVWLADFFAVNHDDIGKFSQVFDRAALVALPLEMRQRYVQHLQTLLTNNAEIFMVTMDYDPAQMEGPPFYISKKDLENYFPQAEIQEIDRHSLINNHPRWQELELSYLDEVLYQISF